MKTKHPKNYPQETKQEEKKTMKDLKNKEISQRISKILYWASKPYFQY
jgi:hypothetical protein